MPQVQLRWPQPSVLDRAVRLHVGLADAEPLHLPVKLRPRPPMSPVHLQPGHPFKKEVCASAFQHTPTSSIPVTMVWLMSSDGNCLCLRTRPDSAKAVCIGARRGLMQRFPLPVRAQDASRTFIVPCKASFVGPCSGYEQSHLTWQDYLQC